MSAKCGSCLALAILTWSVDAKPVAVPIGESEGMEMGAVLPHEKVLQALLLANAVQIIWFLVKSIWDSFHKKQDASTDKLDALHTMVHRMEERIAAIGKQVESMDLPSEDELAKRIEHRLEFMVFKAVRDFNQKDKR